MVSAETSAGCGPGLGPTPALPAPLASSWASPEASPALVLLPGFDQAFLSEYRPLWGAQAEGCLPESWQPAPLAPSPPYLGGG